MDTYTPNILSTEVLPDPPVRDPYGYATITLKENATPKRENPFRMHGEREAAHLKVTEDWLAHYYLERPFSSNQ
jgi:hypothetical protein